jgi:serine/threonine-protein kinase
VEKGSTITLTIAKAEEKSTVPDVTGQSCDDARAQMQANNLVGNCTQVETEDTNQIGKVIATSPQAGTQVDKNSSVNIQIGKPADKTEVPNVVGQTVAQARQILNNAGFNNIQFANGSDQSDNAFVVQQNPGGGNEVNDPGSTQITLATVGAGGGNNNGGGNNGGGGFFGGSNG